MSQSNLLPSLWMVFLNQFSFSFFLKTKCDKKKNLIFFFDFLIFIIILLPQADQLINLHISVRDHQANNTLNKLTFLSSVFLPLSFTSGVYGMNFVNIPELEWGFGYAYFWLVIAGLTFAICSYYKYKGYF